MFRLKVDSKGRIAIPKSLRDAYRIREGDYVIVEPQEQGLLIRPLPKWEEIERFLEEWWLFLRKLRVSAPSSGSFSKPDFRRRETLNEAC